MSYQGTMNAVYVLKNTVRSDASDVGRYMYKKR